MRWNGMVGPLEVAARVHGVTRLHAIILPAMATEFRFAHYRLRPDERALLARDQPVKLGGRALDTLHVLVERHERAVTKAELMARVWPNLVVEENNLQVQIAALRKVLGPGAIVTIPGRGYRFTLPVEIDAPDAVGAAARAGVQAQAPVDSLPQAVGPLFGREADLVAVNDLLDTHPHVSIVGAGGVGKTRLALAVAAARRTRHARGVRFVELAPIADGALVAAEVARALGVQAVEDASDPNAIAAALAQEDLLVVLDNCEHVLEAVAALADALSRRAPRVSVLVTSQEPLKHVADHVYRLDPLAVPAAADAPDAARHGAVALFAARAAAVDPRFRLDELNVDAVIEICRRLDGIPLALELAAARVPLLGVEGVRARLDERFNILTAGSRFVLRRHQTLRAALDFSHGLLDERERTVLRRTGVFAGTFAIASAQAVCADDALDAWEILDCLGALVDKSLIVAEAGTEPRLRLLETTRAYALEKLAEAGETAAVLTRHAVALATMADGMYGRYVELSTADFVTLYEQDLDNLRAAIDWSVRDAPERAIALVGDSLKLWQELALHPEARRHCEACLPLIGPQTPPRAAGRLWYAEAMLVANMWPGRSADAAERAIPLLRAAGDEVVLVMALARLVNARRGPISDEQRAAFDELRRLERPHWPLQLKWHVPYAEAVMVRRMARYEDARAAYERAHAILIDAGDALGAARILVNIAEVVLSTGDTAKAMEIASYAVRKTAELPDRLFSLFALGILATSLLVAGDARSAREPLEAALPLILHYEQAYRYGRVAALYAALLGDLRAAACMLGHVEAASRLHGDLHQDLNERTVAERIGRLLAAVPAAQLDAWRAEGAAMTDAVAFRTALRAGERVD
jgi:predicted ATPase/DNA-binding winged helix-turn-helix (wHTH) protein